MLSMLFRAVLSRSSIDEYKFEYSEVQNSRYWVISGDHELKDRTISLAEREKGCIIYNSTINRKKWMLEFCANISDISLVFQKEPFTTCSNGSPGYILGMSRDSEFLRFELFNGSSKIQSSSIGSDKSNGCFTILYGRGYISLIHQPHLSDEQADIISVALIPKEYHFALIANKRTSVSKLSLGDFLGGVHYDAKVDTDWNQQIRDFL